MGKNKLGIIYAYTNLESGRMYIGQTTHPYERWRNHRFGKQKPGWHTDYQAHPEKYEYSIIEMDVPEDQLDEREIYWIRFFDSYRNGYNLTEGGLGHRGWRWTDELRKEISERQKGEKNHMWGKHLSENTKKKLSEASKGEKNHFYGKKHTDEAKKKISEANKGPNYKLRGIVRSEETRKKLSEIAKKRTGDKNHMYGKHLSEEARKILSENHKGRHYYNNGVINIMTYECPEGFVPGRLKTWTDNKK